MCHVPGVESTLTQPSYARSGGVNIAYHVQGEGPRDLVWVPNWLSNVDFLGDEPFSHFFARMSSFARLITFDRRGTGLSDPVDGAPTLEERMDDIRAVMDAVGSERAAIWGFSEGAPMAALFAATYPERVSALVLYAGLARATATADYPWAPATADGRWRRVVRDWGTGRNLEVFAPSVAGDERWRAWWARFERAAASPGSVLKILRLNGEVDVRAVLPAIRVPTLIIHRAEDHTIDPENSRYLARSIPGARYVELPGVDHVPMVGDQDGILDEAEEFLTGQRPSHEPDRVLATVLFTDIVGSTELAARLGDGRWRELLVGHDAVVAAQLGRFGGRHVKSVGDGILATFDGPARGIRCARAICEATRGLGLTVRAGLHTGEIEVIGNDVGGIGVHIGARVLDLADAGEVLVSSTVRDLVVGSGIDLTDRGERELRGVPGTWRVYGAG